MAIFSRSGTGSVQSFHTYIAEKPSLQNIGLASYTRNSLEKFGKERKNGNEVDNKDIKEYFGGSIPKAALLGDSALLSILRYDKDNKRYFLCTSAGEGEDSLWYTPSGYMAGLSNFQSKFDLFQKGFITNDLEKYQISYIWAKIQTSLSGCITFPASYSVLSCPETCVVKLYFQSAGKSSSDRGVANKGAPIFAGTPRRATGASYAFSSTQESAPGVYVPQRDGGDNNPENTVAGKMRMNYDPATGQWESGTTQLMFRLLTDIDGVPSKDLPNNVDEVDMNEFYQGGLSSSFTVGSGMPVSTENGNPHLFGPNTNGCSYSPKEKVILVNRTPRSYSKGELVIASLINGEWIPMGFGPPKIVSKKIDIEWSQIQKYIVNAAAFFRDMNDTTNITPEDYETHVRYKFYSSLNGLANKAILEASGNDLSRIAMLNINPQPVDSYQIGSDGQIIMRSTNVALAPNYAKYINLVPSTGYFEFYDADVITTRFGGNNDRGKLRQGNVKQMPLDLPDLNEVYAENVSSSWGLYFRDGYTSSSVARLQTNSSAFSAFQNSAISTTNPTLPKEKKIYSNSTLSISNNYGETTGSLLNLMVDSNFYHMPAQFALNSSGNQTMKMSLLWYQQNIGGSYANNLISYAKNLLKGDYLVAEGNKKVYGLTPVNATSVQFTPLSLELALCGTYIPDNHTIRAIDGGYEDLKINLKYQNWTATAFGAAFTRLTGNGQLFTLNTAYDIRGYVPFGKNLWRPPGIFATPTRNDTRPDGGPGILPEDNGREISNVVGILAAKATINLPAGGQLELRTTNSFGLNAYGVATGGGGYLSFIPTMFGLVPGADGRSEVKKYDFVQWGNSNSYGDLPAFGTTALHCAICDHCPSAIYDGRYLTTLQFHLAPTDLAGKPIDIDVPANVITPSNQRVPIPVGTIINKDYNTTISTIKNPIRRNMLLTGGGFYYIKRALGANPTDYEIKDISSTSPQGGYIEGDLVIFQGSEPATFKVTKTDANGKILGIALDDSLGPAAYGEFTGNPFKSGPLETYTIKSERGHGAKVLLKSGKIIEKVMVDTVNKYPIKILTPTDNNGGGDSYGYVKSSRSVTYDLAQNSNGKYDILFFFVNDIANYPENSAGANGQMETMPFAQYVNLDITAN